MSSVIIKHDTALVSICLTVCLLPIRISSIEKNVLTFMTSIHILSGATYEHTAPEWINLLTNLITHRLHVVQTYFFQIILHIWHPRVRTIIIKHEISCVWIILHKLWHIPCWIMLHIRHPMFESHCMWDMSCSNNTAYQTSRVQIIVKTKHSVFE